MAVKKFKYEFLVIDRDKKFNDQNVHSFRFVNIGETNAIINNGFQLQAPQTSNANYIFDEGIVAGEKTAQGYSVVFKSKAGFKNAVQVIMKVEVTK